MGDVKRFKKGDVVRVLSLDEISATFNTIDMDDNEMFIGGTDDLAFLRDMIQYTGGVFTVKYVYDSGILYINGNNFLWNPDWLCYANRYEDIDINQLDTVLM